MNPSSSFSKKEKRKRKIPTDMDTNLISHDCLFNRGEVLERTKQNVRLFGPADVLGKVA